MRCTYHQVYYYLITYHYVKITFIGQLYADAEKKVATNGKFTTFRAAHNEVYKDDAGNEHTSTIWVDCTLNDHPAVADYLKAGTSVYIEGYPSLRVYSSPKDRCMKAGLTIRIQKIELLGGRVDAVPRQLIDSNGVLHFVTKYYHVKDAKGCQLTDKRGNVYNINQDGWCAPVVQANEGEVNNNSEQDGDDIF